MNLDAIIEEVCVKCQISKNDIFSQRRDKNSVLARNIIYKILSLDGKSLHQISNRMGRDHSTVLWGIRKLPQDYKEYATRLYLKYRDSEEIKQRDNKDIIIKVLMEEIKKLYNRGLKENEIAKELDLTPKRVDIMIKIIKDSCDTKLVPCYNNGTYRTIYL